MATPLIRTARPEDARGMAQVHVASWIAAYTHLLPKEKMAQLSVDEREQAWRDRLADPEALGLRAWVAVIDDQIVGFACTQPAEDEEGRPHVHELAALYLLSSVWRTGIGSALLSATETALRDAGIHSATLWVLEDNEAAKSFYEARAWKIDKRDPSFKDFGAAALRYQKDL